MPAIIDKFANEIRMVQSDAGMSTLLDKIALDFGFRGALLTEYAPGSGDVDSTIDSASNHGLSNRDVSSGLRTLGVDLTRLVGPQMLVRMRPELFDLPSGKAAGRDGLPDLIIAPITAESVLIGALILSGDPKLDAQQLQALPVLVYAMFAQVRSYRKQGEQIRQMRLTRRESQVFALLAQGLTSNEIGERLGMSPRTANQHIDNVAMKLGTRNRTHTVAEVIRRNLLIN